MLTLNAGSDTCNNHFDIPIVYKFKGQRSYLVTIKGQSHSKTHASRTNYAHIFVSARSVRRMRNSSVNRTWTVIDCKWMCVEGGLCVILSFRRFKKFGVRYSWFGVRSLCVGYAGLYAGHASAVSIYKSELVRNRARPRPSTDALPSYYAWTAHVLR